MLWERAAEAAVTSADWAAAVEHAGRARDYYLQRGQARAAARAQAIAGQALRLWGRHAEAREQLTAAVEVLRADPDTDTVRALEKLAAVEVFAGSPDADQAHHRGARPSARPSASDTGQLSGLFITRGIYLGIRWPAPRSGRLLPRSRAARRPGRRQLPPGTRAAQPGGRAGGHRPRGCGGGRADRRRAPAPGRRPGLPGICDREPGPGAADARRLGHRRARAHPGRGLRRAGGRSSSSPATGAGWRRCAATPPPPRPCWRHCGTCGPARIPRTRSLISLVEAFTAAARRQPQDALRHARAALAHARRPRDQPRIPALGVAAGRPRRP